MSERLTEDLLSHDLKKGNKAVLLEKAVALQKLLKEKYHDQVEIPLHTINSNVMADILSILEKLEKENSHLKKEVSFLNKYVDFCDEKIYNLEKQRNHIDQYIRRENIVITGIPDSVSQVDVSPPVKNK